MSRKSKQAKTAKQVKQVYHRVTPRMKHVLDVLLACVQAEDLDFKVSQEEFVVASWHWMAELEPATVARGIAGHAAMIRETMEAIREEEKARDGIGMSVVDECADDNGPTVKPRAKKKA